MVSVVAAIGRSAMDGRPGRQLGLLWGGVAAALIAMSPFAERFAEAVPVCILKSVAGVPCPTCGTTRAALALARLDVLEALTLNPLATLGWTMLVGGGLAAGVWVLAGHPLREPSWRIEPRVRVAVVALLLANWIYLVLAGV